MDQSTSPVPQKLEKIGTLDFYEALRELSDGKKIRSLAWPDDDYGFLGVDGFLSLHRFNKDHHWEVTDGDLLATDWIVVA
jgi:hypothetical protein